MKWILSPIALFCAAIAARADLVMQQQIATPGYNGVITMKIKGTRVRTDMNAGQPQALSSIVDLNTGDNIMLMPAQKLYFKAPGQPAKKGNAPNNAPVPRPTGQTQKVGDYDTELYTWTNSRGIVGTVWVAKNYPDFARIRADYALLDKAAAMDSDTAPALSTLPGMAVRSQVAGGGQMIVLALISVREGPLDASLFGIPRDYKEVPKVKPLVQQPPQAPPRIQPGKTKPARAATGKTPVTSPAQRTPAAPPPPQKPAAHPRTTIVATNLPSW
jgi:hypothetical protein